MGWLGVGRPSDWSLLGGFDPAPGTIEDLERIVRAWAENARTLNDVHNLLSRTTIAGAGASVVAVHALISRDAALVGVYREACLECANAFRSWTGSLAEFQADADRLHALAQQAQDQLFAGEQLIEAGQKERLEAISSGKNASDLPWDGVGPIRPALGMGYPGKLKGQAMINEAQEQLRELRRQARELLQRHREEADRVADALRIPAASTAAKKAGLGTDLPVGKGSLVALLVQGKDPGLTKLNELRGRLDRGDATARAEYLALLASLRPAQLAIYAITNPDRTKNPLPAKLGEDVAGAQKWWNGLDPAVQAVLILTVPGVVGNLNGVPYKARSKANIANIERSLAGDGLSRDARKAFEETRKNLIPPQDKNGNRGASRYLISFDYKYGDKPLAAIAIGDLDTAKNATWNVPGMGTTLADGIGSWTDSAQDLYDAQGFSYRDLGMKNPSTTVISWVGYDTPERVDQGNPDVALTDKAKAGADRLAVALDGFQAARQGGSSGDAKTSLLAHSYGTTTSGVALMQTQYQLDSVTFIGSAGIDPSMVPNAAAMNVSRDTDGNPAVYVTQASADKIAPLGITGSKFMASFPGLGGYTRLSPSDEWFGGYNFSSEGGTDPLTGEYLKPTNGHDSKGWGEKPAFDHASQGNGYLDQGTESLKSVALASTGNGARIPRV